MYCPKCGTENPDGAQICQSCSGVLTSTSTQAPSLEAKSRGRLKGKRLAIAGIAAALLLIILPALFRVKQIAQRAVCATNMSYLCKNMIVYACDNDDLLPTPSKWCDLLIEHADATENQFRCPSASEGPCNYAMNKRGLSAGSHPRRVCLFETFPGWNQSGGPEILTTENHQGKGCNILFADCRVEFVLTEDLNDLLW